MRQLTFAIEEITDKWIYTIERQIYYLDNFESINKSFLILIRKYIIEKNLDWLAKYKLKKIPRYLYL